MLLLPVAWRSECGYKIFGLWIMRIEFLNQKNDSTSRFTERIGAGWSANPSPSILEIKAGLMGIFDFLPNFIKFSINGIFIKSKRNYIWVTKFTCLTTDMDRVRKYSLKIRPIFRFFSNKNFKSTQILSERSTIFKTNYFWN